MRGKQRLIKELIEVRAENETRITALQDALQQTESRLETAKGEVLELLEQLKAQDERRQGDLEKEAREARLKEVQQDKPARERQDRAASGGRELQGVLQMEENPEENRHLLEESEPPMMELSVTIHLVEGRRTSL